ncbi:MAG: PAS domain S-box protein [Cytophagales bacterium]|nr:PAS domain S-box protein [Cytophagales bacterium]
MDLLQDVVWKNRFLAAARVAGMITVAGAAIALIGWTLDNEGLKTFSSHPTTIKLNAAIAFLLSGSIFLLLQDHRKHSSKHLIQGASLAVFLIGTLTMLEYLTGVNIGIDELLVKDRSPVVTPYPGRMAPLAAVSFMLVGASLLTYGKSTSRTHRLSAYLSLTVLLLAIIPAGGYLFGAEKLYSMANFTKVSLPTALMFTTFSLGLLFSTAHVGVFSVFTRNTQSSKIAFFQIVLISLLIISVGWLTMRGYQSGLYTIQSGVSLMVLLFITTFSFILWTGARKMNAMEIREQHLRSESVTSQKQFKGLVESAPDAMIGIDDRGKILFANHQTEVLFGFDQEELLGEPLLRLLPGNIAANPKDASIPGNGVYSDVERGRTRDGKMFPVEVRRSDLSIQNKPLTMVSIRDVTKRTELEAKVRHSEERLSTTLASIGEGVIATDLQGKITFMNPAAELLTGWAMRDAYSKDLSEVYVIRDESSGVLIASPLIRIIEEGRVTTQENHTMLQSRDNKNLIISHNGAPIRDPSGKISGAVLVFRDTTEKSRAAEELERSQAQFNTAFFRNPAPMAITRQDDGKFIEVNPSFEALMGYSRAEILGRTSVALKIFQPEFREHLLSGLNGSQHLFNEETIIQTKDGVRKPVLVSLEPMEAEGTPCLLKTFIDLSAWREAEKRYRSIFDNIHEGVYRSTPDGKFLTVNPSMISMFGYDTADEMIVSVDNLYHQLLVDSKERHALEMALKKKGHANGLEIKAVKKDKKTFWIRANIHTVTDASGKVGYLEGTLEDITIGKKAEIALLRSNENLEQAESLVNLGSWQFDLATQRFHWSKQMFRLFGFDPSQPLPTLEEFLERIHPSDRLLVADTFHALRNGQNPSFREFRTNEDLIPLRILSSAWICHTNKEGSPVRFEGTMLDITERRNSENTVTETAQYFQLLVEQSLTGIYSILDDNFVYVNPRFAQIFGYTQEEMLQVMAIDTVYEPDRPLVTKIVKGRIEGKNASSNYSYRGIKKDGSIIHVEVFAAKAVRNDVSVTIGTLLDVTAQKEFEKRITAIALELTTLIENANVPVFGLDRNGYINEWNRTTSEITGFSRNEVLEKRWIGMLDSSLRPIAKEALTKVLNGTSVSNWELQLVTKNGERLVLLLSMSPRRDNDKNILGAICVGQNITELFHYRQNLERMVEERTSELNLSLQKEKGLVELKSKFVSIASHEFRTPLSSMTLAAESVRHYFDRLSKEDIHKKMVKIEEQALHMTHLLDDILTIGKSDAGKIKVTQIEVDLKKFVESQLEEIKATVKETRRISFIYSTTATTVTLDDKLLRNIINNLLTNALKFSSPDSVVDLSISDDGGNLVFEVADSGIGIHEDELKSIFDPFHRGSNAAHIQGTGLGLSILKKAVELMGGNIHVVSALNHGTVVKVEIPRK